MRGRGLCAAGALCGRGFVRQGLCTAGTCASDWIGGSAGRGN